MTLRAYCENCDKATPCTIDPLTEDERNDAPWGDVVCEVCRLVLLTFSSDVPGVVEFKET